MARAVGQIPTQADKRRSMTLKDRHGRQYFAVIEKSSGYPTGLVQPLYEVPHPSLVPPQKYMGFPEDRPGFLDLDYDAWLGDARSSEAEWEQNRAQLIAELPGGAQNPMLHRHLGPRPINSQVVLAMKQGNRWALGLSKVKPPEAEHFFPAPTIDPNLPVFTETEPGPVFSEPGEEEGAPAQVGLVSLTELLAEVMTRCPKNLHGGAKKAWAMKELERMAVEETAHASA